MRAICLSAGTSSRLLPSTKAFHKSHLIVRGRTILEWQLSYLSLAGINELVLVTGHGAEYFAPILESWTKDLKVITVHNEFYASRNLDYSLHRAASFLNGPILYLEGDLILAPALLKTLVMQDADLTLAASRSSSSAHVDTLVRRSGASYCLEFKEHGDLDLSDSEGEFICAVCLSSSATADLQRELMNCPFTGPMCLYQIFSRLLRRHKSIVLDASDQPWVEVDTAQDLRRAAQVIDTINRDLG
jgi:choline kinase